MPKRKHPHTVPDRSPLYKAMPRHYKGYRKLSIYCRADIDGIRKALPAGFSPASDLIEVFVMHCPEVHDLDNPEMGPRNYLEGGVVVPITFGKVSGGHVLYEYVTTDDALAGGREVWGYPKKLAEVTFKEDAAGSISATVSRLGHTLISAQFTRAQVEFEKPKLHPRLQVKRILRADGKGLDVDQVILNELKDAKVAERHVGTAKLELGGRAKMDPLLELGVRDVIGAEFVVADFILDYGSIYLDRLK